MSETIDQAISQAAMEAAQFEERLKTVRSDLASNTSTIRAAKELILLRGEMRGIRIALTTLVQMQKARGS